MHQCDHTKRDKIFTVVKEGLYFHKIRSQTFNMSMSASCFVSINKKHVKIQAFNLINRIILPLNAGKSRNNIEKRGSLGNQEYLYY